VHGLWWTADDGGGRVRVELEPFPAHPAGQRAVLEAERARVAAFVAPMSRG